MFSVKSFSFSRDLVQGAVFHFWNHYSISPSGRMMHPGRAWAEIGRAEASPAGPLPLLMALRGKLLTKIN